mmetsp:Transcript_15914/g.47875  ORF Transcript_15914/g.47875 Transcript_15914/m.47875 type:complete len:231 (-) Transcript_15914:256-948(-)
MVTAECNGACTFRRPEYLTSDYASWDHSLLKVLVLEQCVLLPCAACGRKKKQSGNYLTGFAASVAGGRTILNGALAHQRRISISTRHCVCCNAASPLSCQWRGPAGMPLGVRSIGTVRPGAAKCIPLSCTLVLTGCSTQSSALCPIPLHLVQTRLRKLQGRYTLCCFSGFRPLRYHGAGLMLGSCVPTALTSRAIGAGFACSSTFTLLAMTAGYTAASSSTYATPTHRPH